MYLDSLQTISLNGMPGKANDDRAGATSRLAWVIDGATDLGEPGLLGAQGGAAWLASAASLGFACAQEPDIAATCQTVFASVSARFEMERIRDVQAAWELPKASFAAAQLVGDGLEIAWAGDCAILHRSGQGTEWCTGMPDSASEIADARALGPGVGVGAGGPSRLSEAALADRRNHRSQNDHAAISPDTSASSAATRFHRVTARAGDELLLMSDGFSSLVSDYDRYAAEALIEAVAETGLEALASEIRAIERADATCTRYPRFKVSDDMTALWLRVAG